MDRSSREMTCTTIATRDPVSGSSRSGSISRMLSNESRRGMLIRGITTTSALASSIEPLISFWSASHRRSRGSRLTSRMRWISSAATRENENPEYKAPRGRFYENSSNPCKKGGRFGPDSPSTLLIRRTAPHPPELITIPRRYVWRSGQRRHRVRPGLDRGEDRVVRVRADGHPVSGERDRVELAVLVMALE